ncbi:hypothetical protein ABK905_09905 [Acerihabitans sp. KWT182]|uniref:Uncharacterized protein n=1 Tax=Acerihabitans sp. KWT182 TaxID=3157919 RepID=A0AAU7QDK3_9GAMM
MGNNLSGLYAFRENNDTCNDTITEDRDHSTKRTNSFNKSIGSNIATSIQFANNNADAVLKLAATGGSTPIDVHSPTFAVANSDNVNVAIPATVGKHAHSRDFSPPGAAVDDMNAGNPCEKRFADDNEFDICEGAPPPEEVETLISQQFGTGKPSGKPADADIPPPPRYGESGFNAKLQSYLEETLLPAVNQLGKAPPCGCARWPPSPHGLDITASDKPTACPAPPRWRIP